MALVNRVKAYQVAHRNGDRVRECFTEAQVAEFGAVLEADGVALEAAFRMVDRWNDKARLQGNQLRYAVLLEALESPLPAFRRKEAL